MQIDSENNAEEYVFKCFDTMYAAFERDRAELKDGQLHEIHYEELVADPYQAWKKHIDSGLTVLKSRPAFERQAESMKGYTTNTYHDPRIVSEIAERWQPFIERYGYKKPATD